MDAAARAQQQENPWPVDHLPVVLNLGADAFVDRPFLVRHSISLCLRFPLTVSHLGNLDQEIRTSPRTAILVHLRQELRPVPSNKDVRWHPHTFLCSTPPSPTGSPVCAIPATLLLGSSPVQETWGHHPPQHLNNLPYQGRTRQLLNLAREEYPRRTKPTEPAAFAAHADHDLQSPRPVQGGTQRQHRPARSSSAHPLKSHNTARTVTYGQARTLCDLSPIAIQMPGQESNPVFLVASQT